MSDTDQYRIGIICAITTEYTACRLILDEIHEPPSHIHQPDPNNYTLGRIGGHNVVIAVLPDGEYGIATAAAVATHMIHSFPNVKTGLMVGIGGGAPVRADIRLGDVVVGAPREGGSGVLQYDFGKAIQEEELRPTRYIDQAPIVLRTAVAGLRSRLQQGLQLRGKIDETLSECKLSEFKRPEIDHLYRSNIIHAGTDCGGCDKSGLIDRPPRASDSPMVHYGLVASADFLMKNAELRDKLANKHGMLCFEMEAAGLANHFPCLIVRGICDYSDSHKNKDWQGYAALTAAIYTKELLSLIDPSQLKEKQTIKDFSVPFGLPGAPILETFYGRGDDLVRLEEALPGLWKDKKHNGISELDISRVATDLEDRPRKSSVPEERDGMRRTVVICGLGGIGKTQLVIEFAKRHSKHYTCVLWLDGKDEASLQNSFITALKRLKSAHPEALQISTDILEPESAVSAVLRWLDITYNDRWLLIFDNVDEPDILGVVDGLYDVRKYFPSTMHGHIIITTRCMLLRMGKQLMLQKITSMNDCLNILKTTSMRPNIDKEAKVQELLARLDGLPLALATTGSYLSQMPDSVEDYLHLYCSSWLELQKDTIGLPEHEGRTLDITWQITADRIKAKDASAWQLLELWTFFSNQDLWYELLHAGRECASEWFTSVIETKSIFGRHMRVLRMYGLVDVQHEPAGYGIHKCLHDWLKATLSDVRRQELRDIALACIARSVPLTDLIIERSTDNWPLQQRLLPHAEEYLAHDTEHTQQMISLNDLSIFANLYFNFSQFEKAEKILLQVLNACEILSGADDMNTLKIACSLSRVQCWLHKTADAETLGKRILDVESRSINANNPLFSRNRMVLGDVYYIAGRYKEAEAILLSIRSPVSNETDWALPVEKRLLTLLSKVYLQQNRHVDAKVILQEALAIPSSRHDSHDYWSLRCKELLIWCYMDTGDLEEAEQLSVEMQDITRKRLGDRHADTIRVANTLGEVYTKLGRLDEANMVLSRAYEDCTVEYGSNYGLALAIGDTLAQTLLCQGEVVEAERLLLDILPRHEDLIGPDHVNTLETLLHLGDVYKAQGRLDEAMHQYDRVYREFAKHSSGAESFLAREASGRIEEINELLLAECMPCCYQKAIGV